jgi:AraC family transcriptional regulator
MDWITGFQRAVDYLEEHLLQELDYDGIVKNAYVSSYHFQRVFHILSGYTLGEYIRNRRLTLAASEILAGQAKIIDIALKYGYETPESFSRAFTRFHGVLPSAARGSGTELKSMSRLSIKVILEGGSVMDYRIENKSAFLLLAKSEKQNVSNVQVPAFWDKCLEDGTVDTLRRLSTSEDKCLIGMADGSSFDGESYTYYVGTPFEGREAPEGYVIKEIPAQTWALFRCVNLSEQDVNAEMFRKIYSEFFPTSEYSPKEYQLEVFPDDALQYRDVACEVWIAVGKKEMLAK